MIGKTLLTTTAAVVALTSSAIAQEQVSIGTSSSGSGPYVNGSLMADTVSQAQEDYKFSVQTTGGYKDNLGLVLSDKVELALNSLINLEFAYNQRGEFGEVAMKDDFKDLRYVFTFGVVPHNIFVREDSGISSLQEIKGNAFNIHVPASFTHGLNLELLEAADISLDDFEEGNVSTGQVFDEVQNDVFAGGSHIYQLGLGNAQRLSSTTPIRYLDVPEEVLDKMNENYHGLLVPFEIPANTYKGQDEDVQTFGVAQVIFTDKDADEEMIYQFTKNFWENLDSLQEANSSFRGVTPELGAKMYGMEMHPGAKRYFEEAGVL
ncbi:MAG: TAXI family TRAP transporter solute-binding subunit [Pseudomonadota bacterium]